MFRWAMSKMAAGTYDFGGGFFGFTVLGSTKKQLMAYQGWVYNAVEVIKRRYISVPFELVVKRGGDEETIEEHVFLDLWKQPNPNMTGRDLKQIISLHMDLTGKFFGLIVENSLGRPAEIWPLPPQNFLGLNLDGQGAIATFEFSDEGGQKRVFSRDEIIYLWYPHPLSFLHGASPIQAQAHAYDIDLAVRVYQRSFFQNSARPDMVLQTEQKLFPEDAERLLTRWKQKHQGAERAFEPAILDQGLTAQPLTVSAKDFEFMALAGWTKDNLLAAYNVPEGKLGLVKDVNKANSLGIDITFNSECILPRFDLFDDKFTASVMIRYDSSLELRHKNPVPRDIEFEHKRDMEEMDRGALTINEHRKTRGYDPLEGGDVGRIPMSQIPITEDIFTPEGEAGAEELAADALGFTAKDYRKAWGHLPEAEQKRRRRRWLGLAAATAREERKWKPKLRKFFKAQESRVLERLRGMERSKAATKDMLDMIWYAHEENEALGGAVKPLYQSTVTRAGAASLAEMEVAVAFDLQHPAVQRYLEGKLLKIRRINETTRERIRAELTAGNALGETIEELSERVAGIYQQARSYRTQRIARTEVIGAHNKGALEGYRQSGVVQQKEWLAGPEARDTHADADGQVVGLDEKFVVGDCTTDTPGNSGCPEEDINCRCAIAPVAA